MKFSDTKILDVFIDMVKLDTTNPEGNEKRMTDYIGKLLTEYGIDYEIIEPELGRTNLVARIGNKASQAEQPPVVFISHVDVVGCDNQDWSYPPFSATEVEGLIYGRGTLDTKYLTATQLLAFIEHKDSNLPFPVYFVATADEEKGSSLGMPHVVQAYSDDFLHARVINEGGGFYIENQGKPYHLCTVGEKGRCDVRITIDGVSGPASFKAQGKAVDTFTELLQRLSEYEFHKEETSTYRQFAKALGEDLDDPFLQKFAWYNSHDAFIIQKYQFGRQVNVLPAKIEFDMALQLLPGRTEEDAREILDGIFSSLRGASYGIKEFLPGFESNSDNAFFETMQECARQYFPMERVIPVYALGRTDGRFIGLLPADVYGFGPMTDRIPFSKVLGLVHQVDEHIDSNSVILGTRFLSDLLTKIGS